MAGTTDRRHPTLARLSMAILAGAVALGGSVHLFGQSASTGWTVVAWNNLGMHCMDADFGVFAILPPYNTIQAQVIDSSGNLVTNPGGLTITYEASADPTGSINTTSLGKTNFWDSVLALFKVALPVDAGLVGNNMPGARNNPQPMTFEAALNWFIAEGIPITPFDDGSRKNFYPLMKVTARDATGAELASTRIVLPVSDEMDCRSCHGSGSVPAAQPAAGWVFDPNPQRDFRLNILRLHDDRQLADPAFVSALATAGYSTSGLYATATTGHTPILSARCHLSEALKGSGLPGVPPLTASIHTLHANVLDPTNGLPLDSTANRSACYRCHPGSETRCLRGVMGNSVAPDGTMAIQCQNCHGQMSTVGDPNRTGWLQEPVCQSCHTGTAVQNSGQIRYTSALTTAGQPRAAANPTFATMADTPVSGSSLYRFSAGHGGLQCSACHGSTHAEYPSSHQNDNIQSDALQGHVGTLAECGACHTTVPTTTSGGPHGMHPVGAAWVERHHDAIGGNPAQCQACHGIDYRGTVLSQAFGPRTLNTSFGTKILFRGSQIGCYMCHNGPNTENANPNRPPVATNLSAATGAGVKVGIQLVASDPDGNPLTLRIVSQPANGTVGLAGTASTYFPNPGFVGTDTFTYAARDGSIDSNLATVTVSVAGVPCTLASSASAPATATVGVSVAFTGSATPSNCTGSVSFDWNFGDGTPHVSFQSPTHIYAAAGTFTWTMVASIAGVTSSQTGAITVSTAAPPPAPAPVISSVRALSEPFRIQINGNNFQQGVQVFIGADTTPWPGTQRVSAQQIVLSGSGLSARFPRERRVTIRVTNPDGQSATTTFRRGN